MWFRISRQNAGDITISYKQHAHQREPATTVNVSAEQAAAIRDLLTLAINAKTMTMEVAKEG